jgi:hypothetical protein
MQQHKLLSTGKPEERALMFAGGVINNPDKERVVRATLVHLLPVLSLLAMVVALTTGCACTAISNNQWAGHKAPKIGSPEDIAKHLRQSVNGEVRGFSRSAAFFFTPFKRIGIFGWSDLGYDGEITGVVKQAAKSTDQFYTVDMKLETLQINGQNIPLADDRYLRAEICLCEVKLSENDRPRAGEKVWMRGRMIWDGDGFVEIHPRSAAEVGRASPGTQ